MCVDYQMMHSLLIKILAWRKEQPYLTFTYLVRTAGTEIRNPQKKNVAMALPASKLLLLNINYRSNSYALLNWIIILK